MVLISLWSHRERLPLFFAVLGTALTIMGYYFSPPVGELWKVLFNRSLALFAIWATAILVVQKETIFEEKEKAQSEVKVLKGLLPICASCKKIRDNAGYWNQIESYFKDNSDVETVETTVTVIYCDKQVKRVERFNRYDLPLRLNPLSGDGTDFRPPFEWIKEKGFVPGLTGLFH